MELIVLIIVIYALNELRHQLKRRDCPWCGESVSRRARFCLWCGEDFRPRRAEVVPFRGQRR